MKKFNRIYDTRHGKFICSVLDHYIGGSLSLLGECCELELRDILRWVTPDSVVIDAGACIGTLAIPISRHCRTVLAIEPESHNFMRLCGNVALNNRLNVLTLNAAVGDHDGIAWHRAVDPQRETNIGGLHVGEVSENEARRATQLVRLDSLGMPADLIKLDVEGMEAAALRGASELLMQKRPIIYCEMLFAETSREVCRILWDYGYDGWRRDTPYWHAENYHGCNVNPFGETVSANAVWIHRDASVERPTEDQITEETYAG